MLEALRQHGNAFDGNNAEISSGNSRDTVGFNLLSFFEAANTTHSMFHAESEPELELIIVVQWLTNSSVAHQLSIYTFIMLAASSTMSWNINLEKIIGFRSTYCFITYTNQYAPAVFGKCKISIKSIETEKTLNRKNAVEIYNVAVATFSCCAFDFFFSCSKLCECSANNKLQKKIVVFLKSLFKVEVR